MRKRFILTQKKAASGGRFAIAAACTVSFGAVAPKQARAQSTVTYSFGAGTPVATHTGGTYTNVDEGTGFSIGQSLGTVTAPINTTSASSGYTGASGSENLGNAVKTGAFASGTSSYYTLTLTPSSGDSLSLSEFDFAGRSTTTGPTTYALYSSLDSYGSAVFTDTVPTTSIYTLEKNAFTLSDPTGAALTLRLYTSGGSGNASSGSENSRIDDVSLTYTTATIGGGTTTGPAIYFDVNGATAGSGVTNGGTYTFSGSNFNPAADGTGTTAAFASGQTATFAAGTLAAGTAYTVNVDTAVSTNGMLINSGTLTLAQIPGGTLTLTGSSVNVSTGAAALISAPIGGAVGLTKDGGGVLTLTSASSSFTGIVTADAGVLSIGADTNLGPAANNVALNSGTLQASAGFSTARGFTGSGGLDIVPNATLVSTGAFAATAVTLVDSGSLDLQGASPSVGNLAFSAPGKLESTTGGTISTTGFTAATLASGTATISAALTYSGTTSITTTVGAGGELDVTGTIATPGLTTKTGNLFLSKQGAGVLDLYGNNSALYRVELGSVTTGTPAAAGTININNPNSLGANQFFLNAGTLNASTDLTASTGNALQIGISVGALSNAPAVLKGSNLEFTGATTIYESATLANQLTVNNTTILSGPVTSSSGSISVLQGFIVSGAGVLELTGQNAFMDPVMISGTATLSVAGTQPNSVANGTIGALSAVASVTVNNGGTLLLATANQVNTAAPIKLNGGATSVAAFASQGAGATIAVSMVSGNSTVGLGALTLSANSILAFPNNPAPGSGNVATLVFTSFDPTNAGAGTYKLNVTGSDFGTTTAGGVETDSANGTNNRLIFEQDITNVNGVSYLGDITFNGFADATETMLDPGYYEITPNTALIPEPGTWLAGGLTLALLGWSQRRRVGRFAPGGTLV